MGAIEQARLRERLAPHADEFRPRMTRAGDALLVELLREYGPDDITAVVQLLQQPPPLWLSDTE
ncbi:hypothetical protein QIS99_28815 [Streptomyces sp. B-S-A8]|uniref:Uncharacterized protein n=1 Tax=Streptomyces solicavernae TaxID=3043614 RepID=A0ABT6S0F9_9ACTN|nr:hypothetical protein [Streptomyces sp. B-S-A8]MDI3390163.1 hypothetical protein [Streptomyces sp. B-S-A8]